MEVRNPEYNQHGTVDLELDHPEFGWIPFTASPDDPEPLGRELYAKAIAGDFGDIAPYEEPVQTSEQLADEVRGIRDAILQDTVDPIVSNPLRWEDMSQQEQDAWRTYRRALLDISLQEGFPQEVIWPEAPE